MVTSFNDNLRYKISKCKTELLEGMVLLPGPHKHRDPEAKNMCRNCLARERFERAYKSLPSNIELGVK